MQYAHRTLLGSASGLLPFVTPIKPSLVPVVADVMVRSSSTREAKGRMKHQYHSPGHYLGLTSSVLTSLEHRVPFHEYVFH